MPNSREHDGMYLIFGLQMEIGSIEAKFYSNKNNRTLGWPNHRNAAYMPQQRDWILWNIPFINPIDLSILMVFSHHHTVHFLLTVIIHENAIFPSTPHLSRIRTPGITLFSSTTCWTLLKELPRICTLVPWWDLQQVWTG